ncbi:hypothetical protein Tco_0660423, partial [Tanacetum coccineum]
MGTQKRVTNVREDVYRVLPPATQEEQFADEKERKARTLLLMAVPKGSSQTLSWHGDAKEIAWQQSDKIWLVQKLLSQLDASGGWLCLMEDANHSFEGPFLLRGQFSHDNENVFAHTDSYNALQAKYDELQSEFGDQEAALTAHKLAVKKLESQLRASHKQQSSLTEKLNFQANQIFEKDEKLKKYRRIGMKAVKDKDALQNFFDSWSASS